MGHVQTIFHHYECNGPAATPFKDHCSAEMEGGWNQEEVEQAGLADGWTKEGRSWFCPKHRPAPAARKNSRAVPEQ